MVLGSGTSGRLLGHEGRALISEMSGLLKETQERAPLSLLPCEDIARGWLSMYQETGSHENQTSNLQNC